MKTLIRLLTLTLLLTLGGCVPSLQPFYADKDVAFDPTLLGTWSGDEGKDTWEFTKHGERGYKLHYTDEEGRQGRFVVYRFRLAGNNLLDLYPEEPEPRANDFYKHHLLRLHTFLLVLQVNPPCGSQLLTQTGCSGFWRTTQLLSSTRKLLSD